MKQKRKELRKALKKYRRKKEDIHDDKQHERDSGITLDYLPALTNAITLLTLFDGLDETGVFLPRVINWLSNFVDENVHRNQHQHITVVTARPSVLPDL